MAAGAIRAVGRVHRRRPRLAVGNRVGDLQYPTDQLPRLSTFKTDIGVGFDAGLIGLFVAKSVSDSKEPPNFFVRVGKRF